MPQPLPPQTDELIRDLQASLRDCQQRLALLEGRRRLDLPRGLTENIPAPGEGEALVRADSNRPWYYADGEWRPFAAPGFSFKLFADTGALDGNLPTSARVVTTGDGKIEFQIPESFDGLDLVYVGIYVSVVSSSGAIQVQIRNSTASVDVLSTKVSIDAGEKTSKTAATPFVIDAANAGAVWGDMWAIDVDAAGTGAEGLGCDLEYGRAA